MPSVVRKPAAACTAGDNTCSLARRTDDVDHYLLRNNNSPGKKQSAEGAHLEDPYQKDGGRQKDAASRKRTADQLGEDIVSATEPSVKSTSDGGGTIRPRKKKAPRPAPAVDWRVQRIVRDLGRLDVLRRGDVGPDVVSDDDDETALDILVRKLVEDAEEGHVPAPADNDYDYIGGYDNGDDYSGGAMDIDDYVNNDVMPAAPDHVHGDDADSIAVVTHNGDVSLADGAGRIPSGGGDVGVGNGGDVDVIDPLGDGEDEGSNGEDTAGREVGLAAAGAISAEPSLTDVMYNHGARNPLNDPTAKPVYCPGDDDVLGPMNGLVRRQIEWFAATSKDVVNRKLTKFPIVLGQVGFRCVHCVHIPFTARATCAVLYPKNYHALNQTLTHYKFSHLMNCEHIPTNIKAHSKSLLGRQGMKKGKQRREHLIDGFQSIGIIEEDGRLVYNKSSEATVGGRRDVIGSDGSEEGYWLCDKCQSLKFANFDEACRHEETCCGTAAKPDFSGLDQSGRLLHNGDTLPSPSSTNRGEGAYVLSLCCECREVEDPSSDVPMLLCDGCDSATHLTCTKDIPKLIEVPEGEWHCSKCSFRKKFKEKRFAEDQAITTAFTAVGDVLEDNYCATQKEGTRERPRPKIECNLDDILGTIPGIQSKFQPKVPGKRRPRLCVVIGCKLNAQCSTTRRYMCRAHFARVLLLEKIQTVPNGERRFPCTAKDPSLPRDHENAYVTVPQNANHGTLVKCSSAFCRSLGTKRRQSKRKYCAVCDNIFSKTVYNRLHRHEHEQTEVDTTDQVASEVGAKDESAHAFESIRGHTKDRKRKGEFLFRVKWSNGEITSEPDTYLREDDPASFVAYLKSSGLSKTKKYAWVNK